MTARDKRTIFEVCHTDAYGRKITGQLYTAESVSRRLQDLLEWGCTNITVKEHKESTKRNVGETIPESFNYKDFIVRKSCKGNWIIENLNGEMLRVCKSKKECKERIDEQRV